MRNGSLFRRGLPLSVMAAVRIETSGILRHGPLIDWLTDFSTNQLATGSESLNVLIRRISRNNVRFKTGHTSIELYSMCRRSLRRFKKRWLDWICRRNGKPFAYPLSWRRGIRRKKILEHHNHNFLDTSSVTGMFKCN